MRNRGFTLLELLLAMTVGALVAASALGLLRSGLLARRVARQSATIRCRAMLAVDRIAGELGAAVMPGGSVAAEFTGLDDSLDGDDADELTFFTLAGPADFGSDLVRVRYGLASDADGSLRLTRLRWTNLLTPRTLEGELEVICRRVESLSLRYYDGYAWSDDWDADRQDGAMPSSVEIILRLAPEADAMLDEHDEEYAADLAARTVRRLVRLTLAADAEAGP